MFNDGRSVFLLLLITVVLVVMEQGFCLKSDFDGLGFNKEKDTGGKRTLTAYCGFYLS